MCGIVLARTIEEAERMLEVLEHRGRDERRLLGGHGWIIGQNRLAIVDKGPRGSQPLTGGKGITTFNGEIYNYGELYDALEKKPKERSEIHVIDSLMEEHGEFDRLLDGYYAIIRVDGYKVTLSRDLFGVIPLYYSVVNGRLVAAASEKKALAGTIQEVGAGETRDFYSEGLPYRRRTFDPYSLHLEDLDLSHLEFLFKRAVRRRFTHSEVPVTVALSGGLDSSLVLWVAVQMRLKVDTITVGYDENSDEVQNARELAELAGVEWEFVKLDEETVKKDVDRIKYHLEDPEENPVKWRGMLRNYYVAKHAKGTVILCGEGADEIGAGYPSHQKVGDGLALEWKVLSTVRSMPAINLDRVNKGGMAWTKEFRTPFLDRALVLYVLACKKEQNKSVFRKLADRVGLPGFILRKSKYGSEEKALETLR